MKKIRWTGILLLLALVLPLRTVSETRQGIIVDSADSTLDTGMTDPGITVSVAPRIVFEYANSTRTFELGYPCSILDDGAPPVISGVHAMDITASTATIVWTTNEAATSEVECGLVPDDPDKSNSDPVTGHALEMTGLSADTTYFCRVGGSDKCGHHSESDEFSFTTLKPVYLPVILRNW